jgi:hypothetical protein
VERPGCRHRERARATARSSFAFDSRLSLGSGDALHGRPEEVCDGQKRMPGSIQTSNHGCKSAGFARTSPSMMRSNCCPARGAARSHGRLRWPQSTLGLESSGIAASARRSSDELRPRTRPVTRRRSFGPVDADECVLGGADVRPDACDACCWAKAIVRSAQVRLDPRERFVAFAIVRAGRLRATAFVARRSPGRGPGDDPWWAKADLRSRSHGPCIRS